METIFIADSMLGRLAKWLRALGYDTIYEPFYKEGNIEASIREGRKLLSRHRPTVTQYPDAMLIRSDHVRDQLMEMKTSGQIPSDRSKWFTRCLICNSPLREADAAHARENVPEYVFHQNISGIRFCPTCSRYFWPGSHKERMIRLLEEWGF